MRPDQTRPAEEEVIFVKDHMDQVLLSLQLPCVIGHSSYLEMHFPNCEYSESQSHHIMTLLD